MHVPVTGGICHWGTPETDVHSETLQSHPWRDLPGGIQQRRARACRANFTPPAHKCLAAGECRWRGVPHIPLSQERMWQHICSVRPGSGWSCTVTPCAFENCLSEQENHLPAHGCGHACVVPILWVRQMEGICQGQLDKGPAGRRQQGVFLQ